MEVLEIIPLLEQAQTRLNLVSGAVSELFLIQQNLSVFGEGLVARDRTITDSPLLTTTTNLLNLLMSDAPRDGFEHDTVIRTLKIAAQELELIPGDPNVEGVLLATRQTQVNTAEQRENVLLLKDELPIHEKLGERLAAIHPTNDELLLASQHRVEYDRLRLLTDFYGNVATKLTVELLSLQEVLEASNDPRDRVQLLTDSIPVALLPVRVETRFMTIKHIRNNKAYLNDNEAIRTDTDVLTANTINRNRAMQDSAPPFVVGDLQPAPVQEFVADKHELWVRIYPDDIAIHTHENLLAQDEYAAAQIYWEEVWRAGNVLADERGAWRVLAAAYGPRRAAWIAQQTTPTNPTQKPAQAVPQPATLAPLPTLPTLTLKSSTWTEQPTSKVMPDRFVVRVYSNAGMREVLGMPVPSPLPVGFNPTNTSYLNQSNGLISIPPEMRWMTDFETAEQVGMGIRIPLQGDEGTNGFSRLLVLGLRTAQSPAAGAQQLEELFNNHHYKNGLALVPQGTATNNTDDKNSGYESYEPTNDETFATERQGPLFTSTSTHYDKADGQRLAESLGISSGIFQHVANSNTKDVKESIAMNRALWSGTLGYYMNNLLTPAITPNDVSNTRTFFTNYVTGRGLIPAFRVGNQPYGVLPATVYSRWTYNDPYSYDAKLHTKILQPLNSFWENNFVPQVEHITGQNSSPDVLLTDLLGLHPSSLQFHQRMSAGSYTLTNLLSFAQLANLPSQTLPVFNVSVVNNISNLYSTGIGFNFNNMPRILGMTFMAGHRLLNGPVIDKYNLSEKRPIHNVVNGGTTNYIGWLAQSPLANIRDENFTNIGANPNPNPPQALLYLLLRHAWFLEHLDASLCLLKNNGIVSQDAGMHYEFIRLAETNNQPVVTKEHRDMLYGKVRSEVMYEHDLLVEDTMLNLSTNQDYLRSGMTPEQYEQFIRDQLRPQVTPVTQDRYTIRLQSYQVEQSLWNYLTSPYPAITNRDTMEDYLRTSASNSPCLVQLNEVRNALNLLTSLPTARLERCLAEHLDTCAYRLDSWLTGMVSKRLFEQRAATPGVYIGGYSIIENLKPSAFRGIHVVNLDNDADRITWQTTVTKQAAHKEFQTTRPGDPIVYPGGSYITPIASFYQPATFIYLGEDTHTQLVEDRATGKIIPAPRINLDNQGFILSPSLNHAIVAAILRAGYVAHKKNTTATGSTLAVNLTSARVRKALFYLEGIRNGQTLSALLGYQFERGLHDHVTTLGAGVLDVYLESLRNKFPLVAGSVVNVPPGSNADAQARNVTDGLRLIEAYRNGTWTNNLSIASGHVAAIVNEIVAIIDSMDAVGDLLLSEAVYQLAKGNHDRAGAVLKAMSYGNAVPEPEIVDTPRQGNVLTNRCVVQLAPAVSTAANWTGTSYRKLAEPALNDWLAGQLPKPNDIRITVSTSNLPLVTSVNLNNLGLQPIDLIGMFSTPGSDMQSDSSELSRRITYYLHTQANSDSQPVAIDYRSRAGFGSTEYTVFELLPLIRSLINIVGHCRPLTPEDFVLPGMASTVIPATLPAGMGLNNSSIIARLGVALNATSAPFGLAGMVTTLTSAKNAATASTPSTLTTLRAALMNAAQFGIDTAIPETSVTATTAVADALKAQAVLVLTELNRRIAAIGTRYTNASAMTDRAAQLRELNEVAKLIFGRSFKVFPSFGAYNSSEITASLTYPSLLQEAGTYAIDEWMQGVARVRPQMGEYSKEMMLSESMFKPVFTKQHVVQIPVVDTVNFTDRWMAMKLPTNYEVPGDTISCVIESDMATPALPTCGMVIDEWTEQIPVDKITTGIAMHYDQPSNEAPQSILLAVTPQITGSWNWNDLMDTLNETVLMAAKRAVEPDMIHASALSQVLPALFAPMTGGTNTSPTLDFARNIIAAPPATNSPIDYSAFTAAPQNPNDLTIGNSNVN